MKKIIIATTLFFPLGFALAQPYYPVYGVDTSSGTVGGIVSTVQYLLDIIIPIIMTLALIYFFWGLANYILSAGDEEKKSEGRNQMIYGVIALFVMAAVWGLVGVLDQTFLGGTGTDTGPESFEGLLIK
ncbi:MAG: pilin [Patescibacteria group bacterium]